jgi:ribosomal protein L32
MDKVVNNYLAAKRMSKCESCGDYLEYQGLGKYQCKTCGAVYLDDYGKVRDYLDTHGPAPAVVISKNTGVSRTVVNALLYEGRVEIPEGSTMYLNCEKCGCSLKFGRICPKCAQNMGAERKNYSIGEVPKYDNSLNGRRRGLNEELHGRMHVRTGERLSGFSK